MKTAIKCFLLFVLITTAGAAGLPLGPTNAKQFALSQVNTILFNTWIWTNGNWDAVSAGYEYIENYTGGASNLEQLIYQKRLEKVAICVNQPGTTTNTWYSVAWTIGKYSPLVDIAYFDSRSTSMFQPVVGGDGKLTCSNNFANQPLQPSLGFMIPCTNILRSTLTVFGTGANQVWKTPAQGVLNTIPGTWPHYLMIGTSYAYSGSDGVVSITRTNSVGVIQPTEYYSLRDGALLPPIKLIPDAGAIKVRFIAEPGRTNILETSPNLKDWTVLHTTGTNVSGYVEVTPLPGSTSAFFRLRYHPP